MSAATRIGVVGLGNIGMGIARNLLAAGHPVIGYNRTAAKLNTFAGFGGEPADNPAAVGAAAEIVFVVLVDAAQTREAIFSDRGLAETMPRGGVIVVCGTIGRDAVEDLADRAAARGLSLVDCPVSGGRGGADAGTLTLMVAGDSASLARCAGAFDAIAQHVAVVGERAGAGQVVKSCMQGLVGCIYAGMFEAMVLGVKAGIGAETLFAVIDASVAGTPLFSNAVPAAMRREFSGTGSTVDNTYKDLTLTLALAADAGAATPVTAAAQQLFQAGVLRFSGEDNQSLVKLLEEVAGAEVRGSG